MTVKKVIIPRTELPPINVNMAVPQHVIRFRIRSDDFNRSSDWTTLYKVPAKLINEPVDTNVLAPLAVQYVQLSSNPYQFQFSWSGSTTTVSLQDVEFPANVPGEVDLIEITVPIPNSFVIGDAVIIKSISNLSENQDGKFVFIGKSEDGDKYYIKPVATLNNGGALITGVVMNGVPAFSTTDIYYEWNGKVFFAGTFGTSGTFITDSLSAGASSLITVYFQYPTNPKFSKIDDLVIYKRSVTG